MILEEIDKEPYDAFGYGARYHPVLAPGEYLSSCALVATRLIDAVDVTSSFLVSSVGSIPSSTATSGGLTTIVAAIDLAVAGFRIGDWVVNQTKGYIAKIKDIRFTAAKNDTLVFEIQSVAAANADVFSAAKAIANLRAGSSGNRISVSFSTVTNLGNQFQDELIVNVKDY